MAKKAAKKAAKKKPAKKAAKKKPATQDFLKDWKELNKNPPRVGPKPK